MDTQILMNIMMVIIPILLVAGTVAVWFATWVLFFQERSIIGGVVLTAVSLLATFFAVVALNIQFGWSVPFDYSGQGLVW